MTYAQYGNIQASDFNALCGGTTATANTLNTTWSTGTGSSGYGQTLVANVTTGGNVTATGAWASMVNNTSNAAIHQGTTIISVTAPSVGDKITFNSAIPTNLQTIYANRLNASIQGSTTSNVVTYGSAWQNSVTFTFNVSFANGDAARYFFNSGGQIKLSCVHPTGTGINLGLSDLAANVGNVYLSATTSGTTTIVGNSFSGITKFGGGGNTPSPYLTNNGYYALTTSNATVFTQTATTGPSLDTNISFLMKSNGTQGINADTGNVITIYSVWDQIPDGLSASPGSQVTVTAIYPESTYIANTWGAVTLSGSVTGI